MGVKKRTFKPRVTGPFDTRWTQEELDKIAEIKARPPEERHFKELKGFSPKTLEILKGVEGLSDTEVVIYLKKHMRHLGG